MKKEEAETKFFEALASGNAEQFGVTASKASNRGIKFYKDSENSGKWICEIERHRAIGGDTYSKGCAMSNFETYLHLLRFDPSASSIDEAGEKHVSYNIDIPSLASIHLEGDLPRVSRGSGKKMMVEMATAHLSFKTSSQRVAMKRVKEEINKWDLLHLFECLEEIPVITKKEYADKLRGEMVKQALSRLKEEWDNITP